MIIIKIDFGDDYVRRGVLAVPRVGEIVSVHRQEYTVARVVHDLDENEVRIEVRP